MTARLTAIVLIWVAVALITSLWQSDESWLEIFTVAALGVALYPSLSRLISGRWPWPFGSL